MLILTRRVDQGIIISGNICVRVLGVERDRVKIGISAPLEVVVLREELLERDSEKRFGRSVERGGNDDAGKPAAAHVNTRREPPANSS